MRWAGHAACMGEKRNVYNEELRNLYCIFRMVKSRRMRWTGM
jgi:hypothetical protein